MKNFVCCLIFLVSSVGAFSQKVYFVYLQTEAGQPFFVKMGEKTYHANTSGYLILSQMKDSTYKLRIGFPQHKSGEQQFSVNVKSKDRGFLLKDFGEKGWGLFDLQTMSVVMSTTGNALNKTGKTGLKEVSVFTDILSKAANDPSLREEPVFAVNKEIARTINNQRLVATEGAVAQRPQPVSELKTQITEEKKAENVQPVSAAEQKPGIKEQSETKVGNQDKAGQPLVNAAVIKEDTAIKIAARQMPADQKEKIEPPPLEEYKRSEVVKRSESSTTDGFGLTFVDQYADGQKDTIQIVIPKPDTPAIAAKDQRQDEKKFLDITNESKEIKAAVAKSGNNCSSTASENDFIRLRKRMAAQMTEEAMINEAKKGFKARCFTTEQIKHLGSLFRNEPARFQFFEAAYPFSVDRNNFTVLQAELKENYFIYRFNNLVKTQ